jgi:hypothetical protein
MELLIEDDLRVRDQEFDPCAELKVGQKSVACEASALADSESSGRFAVPFKTKPTTREVKSPASAISSCVDPFHSLPTGSPTATLKKGTRGSTFFTGSSLLS